MTSDKNSITLFDTLKRRLFVISCLKALPVSAEKPPIPFSQESIAKMLVGRLSMMMLIDIPLRAFFKNSI